MNPVHPQPPIACNRAIIASAPLCSLVAGFAALRWVVVAKRMRCGLLGGTLERMVKKRLK